MRPRSLHIHAAPAAWGAVRMPSRERRAHAYVICKPPAETMRSPPLPREDAKHFEVSAQRE